MAKASRQKIVSKKHLARIEREQMQTRYILIGVAIIVVLVVGFAAYGLIDQLVVQPAQPVAVVNGDEITTAEFQAMVRYLRLNLIQQWYQYQQFKQMFGGDGQSFVDQTITQLEAQLNSTESMGNRAINQLVDTYLVRQEAAARGITISEAEIDQYLQESRGFYANGTPTPTATRPAFIPPTLSATQLAMVTATPTITPTATPTMTATATAVPLPTLTPSRPLTPTATATPYTEALYNKNWQEDLKYLKSEVKLSEAQIRTISRDQLLYQKVLDAVIGELPHEEEQVWLRQIVVSSQITATQIISRLQAGEDFGALAAELSLDPSNAQGGDMGWLNRENLTARTSSDLSDVAFSLEIGKLSGIIETPNGWHIIQVIDRQVRPIPDSLYEQLRQQKFQEWLEAKRNSSEVQILDLWKERVPTIPTLPVLQAQP